MDSLLYRKNNNIAFLLITVLTFLPLTTKGNLVRIAIVGALFLIKLKVNGKISVKMARLFVAMIMSLLLPYVAVILVEGTFNMGALIHEVQRLGIYILLMAVIYDYKVSFKYLYFICIVILVFNFTIQVLQYNGVTEVTDFIRNYYLTSDTDIHLMLSTYEGAEFRSGSIYVNPNVYMVIPVVVLALVLQANMIKHSLINYLWALVALGSLLLTGSRTTFIVALCILLFYLLKDQEAGIIKWLIIGGLVAYVAWNYGILKEEFRVFAVTEGVDSSLEIKWQGFLAYLRHANPLYYITGSLSSMTSVHIDAEWGYIFAYFGVLGMFWYTRFIGMLGRNKEKTPFLSMALKTVICLIACTATIVLCMPIFSFFCMVGLVEIEV